MSSKGLGFEVVVEDGTFSLSRRAVVGGWLYLYQDPQAVSMSFVPETQATESYDPDLIIDAI